LHAIEGVPKAFAAQSAVDSSLMEAEKTVKRRVVVAVLWAQVLLFFAMVGFLLLRKSNRPPLPALDDIANIRIRTFYDKAQHREVDFDIPEKYWSETLGALSPYEKDHDPADWKILACMDVTEKNGDLHGLLLFYLENEPIGAFAFAEGQSVYYRGGNSIKLKQVHIKACAKSKVNNRS
jgi:hypothetical protein